MWTFWFRTVQSQQDPQWSGALGLHLSRLSKQVRYRYPIIICYIWMYTHANVRYLLKWKFSFFLRKPRVYVETSNVNDIETKAQTFRYRSLLSERKKNVLIWSAYFRNESKTFWFGTQKIFLQAERFPFGPKILGRSKAIWFGLESV